MAENGHEIMAADLNRAEELKLEANQAFQEHKFSIAVNLYTEALRLNPTSHILLSNRAFAHIKLEEYGSAIEDATRALEIDPRFVKAYYRRGTASMGLAKIKDAWRDFKKVVQVAPRDQDAQRKLKECEKTMQMMRFQEAIRMDDDQVSVAESIDLSQMEVESSWTGARLEGDTITLEFIKAMMDDFRGQRSLHKRYAFQILLQVRDILKAVPTLVDITVPDGKHFTVCGDIHGQFYDLLNIFEMNGLPSDENPYLFNGDFVDRGSFSAEVIFTLFAFKCLYPTGLFLSRGNHESKSMNKIYGFEGEIKAKYTDVMADLFTEVFCCLPLANCINSKVLVVHGGLFSQDGVKLADIRGVDRFREPPDDGLMCEMLWSDPQPAPGRAPSKRGVGVSFGPDVTARFLQENNLELLVRSHEVKDEGYLEEHNGKCITVFSAPNYCDQMGNKGAFIRFTAPDFKPAYTTYSAVPHPSVRPMAYANSFFSMLA